MASTFTMRGLDQNIRAITSVRDTLFDRVIAVLAPVKDDVVQYAKDNHPWQNQSGDAEEGLHGDVVARMAEQIVELYLAHGENIFYAKYLEEHHGGKYGVIQMAIDQHGPAVRGALQGVLV
jgi:hypothetical protein